LLGDVAYGGPRTLAGFNIPRQMLHSRELRFRHPVTDQVMAFSAPLPDDFALILQQADAALNDPVG
jgi:23S rRNA-/tRNA-specific pseudouridylate synthase